MTRMCSVVFLVMLGLAARGVDCGLVEQNLELVAIHGSFGNLDGGLDAGAQVETKTASRAGAEKEKTEEKTTSSKADAEKIKTEEKTTSDAEAKTASKGDAEKDKTEDKATSDAHFKEGEAEEDEASDAEDEAEEDETEDDESEEDEAGEDEVEDDEAGEDDAEEEEEEEFIDVSTLKLWLQDPKIALQEYDEDNDGLLSISELYGDGADEAQKQWIETEFKKADANADGHMDSSELVKYLEAAEAASL